MRFLLNRKFVTPMLMALGLLVMLGGEVDSGAIFYGVAIFYWLLAGWWTNLSERRNAAKRRAPSTAQVTAMSSRARRSDGVDGAFSRLDPAWRDWLGREIDARRDANP